MSNFNTKQLPKLTLNFSGAKAYKLDAKMEFATLVASSFVSNQSYRTADQAIERVRELLPQVGPEFAAKAAIYARTKLGMRSITHVIAAELAENAKGYENLRSFLDKVVYRVDDMSEIAAYHRHTYGGNRLPNAMTKGFKKAFNRFNGYQLAKYKMEGNDFSLIDLVNIVRPTPGENNAEALRLLVQGKLAQTGTWEDKLSKAGSNSEAKNEAWAELINEGTIGYLALVRNLRNIESTVDEATLAKALKLLTDESKIAKSKIFPFQLYTAYKQVSKTSVKKAISKALDISCANCPELSNTLVAVDISGSMQSSLTGGTTRMVEAAALMGAALANKGSADLMMFASAALYVNFDPNGSTVSTVNSVVNKIGLVGHGTDFHKVLEAANKKYDRIILVSDMQCNFGYFSETIKRYNKKFNADPFYYSVDLAGYGTTQLRGKTSTISGFTNEIFELISRAEVDPRVLVTEIEAVEL